MEPQIKRLALKYRSITKVSLENSFKWAEEHYEEWVKYLSKPDNIKPPAEYNTRYIVKELKFRGFVKEAKFHKQEGFNYVITLPPIQGYIYPEHLTNNYFKLIKGYRNIYDVHDEIALAGVTHIDIKYTL